MFNESLPCFEHKAAVQLTLVGATATKMSPVQAHALCTPEKYACAAIDICNEEIDMQGNKIYYTDDGEYETVAFHCPTYQDKVV